MEVLHLKLRADYAGKVVSICCEHCGIRIEGDMLYASDLDIYNDPGQFGFTYITCREIQQVFKNRAERYE